MVKNDCKKEAAFTLIEIIAVIIIIGIIALIAVPSVSRYINESRNTAYISYEHTMEDAAKNKVIKCINGEETTCDMPGQNEKDMVYLNELVDKGYVELMKDPAGAGFCDGELSYVEISNTGNDYEYSACLYCGQYKTENAVCTTYTMDSDDPVCGTVTGEAVNERWINTNRTISVACSDATTGCTRSSFAKTFTNTTRTAKISIVDKSGRKTDCNVKVFVDKTLPTCNLKKTGTYYNDLGWYYGTVTVDMTRWEDLDSGVLTYGIGTELANRDYNKQTSLTVNTGITTVMGYVKDKAGNEGICAEVIRVGTEKPKFDFRYKYQIYPNGETKVLSGISESGTSLTTNTTNPQMTIKNLTKYTDVDRVVIELSSGSPIGFNAELIYTTSSGSTGSTTATVASGSKQMVFAVPQGSYSQMTFKFGNRSGIKFDLSKIELYSTNGGIFTNKQVGIKVDPIDTGVRTIGYSFKNGVGEFSTSDTYYTPVNESNFIVTKNAGQIKSDPVKFDITGIDTKNPTVAIKVVQKGTNTQIASGVWTPKTLDFTITASDVGISGASIYYCVDENNTCTPNISIQSGVKNTSLETKTGIYYIRYRVLNAAGTVSSISSYNAKVDTTTPTCSISLSNSNWTNQDITLTITGQSPGASAIASYSWDGGSTFNSTRTKVVSTNGTYTAKVKNQAGTVGTCSVNVTNIDKTTPTCTVTSSNTNWTSNDITLTINGTNPGGSTIDQYSWDGTNYSSTKTKTVGTNGTYNVKIKNTAGTVGTCSITVGNIDKTTPTCSIASSNTNWTSSDITLTVTGSNSGVSGVASYSWDGTNFNSTRTKTVGSNATYTAKVKNGAGTVGTCTFAVGNIDKTTPTCTLTSSNTSWTNQNITLTVAGSNSGVSGISGYSWDGSTYSSATTKSIGSNANYTVKVKNGAGTVGSCSLNVTNIDKTTPTCSISSSNTNYTSSDITLTITGTPKGGSAIASYSWDGTTFNSTRTKTVGSNATYTGKVKNQAGTVGTCTFTVGNIDKTTPSCSISSSNTSWTNQNITLTITGSNTGVSGIASYSWDNGSTFNSTRTKSVGSNGSYTAKVKNGAGTVGTCTFSVGNIDKTAPTCTATKTATGTGGVSATFTCDNNAGGSTTNCKSAVSGVTSTQNYSISDAAGNTGTCTLTVSSKKQKRTNTCSAYNQVCAGWRNTSCKTWRNTTCKEYNKVCNGYQQICNGYEQICNGYEQICNGYEQVCNGYQKECRVTCKCLKQNGQYANIVSDYYPANCNLGNGNTYCNGFCQRKGNKSGTYVKSQSRNGDCNSWTNGSCNSWRNGNCNSWRNGNCNSWRNGNCNSWRNGDCNSWANGDCKTWNQECAEYNQECTGWNNTTCKQWGGWTGWSDDNGCSPSASEASQVQCQTVYY